MNKKNDFIVGNVFTTKKCGSVKVIEYESNTKVKVLFLDTGSEQYVTLQRLRSGGITDKFSKTYNGIGAIGNTTTKKDGKFKNSFLKWRCMLKRCGDKTYLKDKPTYQQCCVSETFSVYENFEKWFDKQVGNECVDFELDKDLLDKGNKIYSEDLCVLLPKDINMALIKKESTRGQYLIGVSKTKSGKFNSDCRVGEGIKIRGLFDTEIDAFSYYKINKENYIKELAEKWKSKIDERAYQALINYTVEITD